ncbi:hypothetical protein QBC36DRAFT_340155 [Triangularia setosa]|uniref:Uncharacterized protein n=1 Tax=Triangularia setosa TaxID=2587417 RepID=A0AAN7A281_9PEZI|nr:hypothetical protein QBC36DRAFT_340155 [Podospora setosa]
MISSRAQWGSALLHPLVGSCSAENTRLPWQFLLSGEQSVAAGNYPVKVCLPLYGIWGWRARGEGGSIVWEEWGFKWDEQVLLSIVLTKPERAFPTRGVCSECGQRSGR